MWTNHNPILALKRSCNINAWQLHTVLMHLDYGPWPDSTSLKDFRFLCRNIGQLITKLLSQLSQPTPQPTMLIVQEKKRKNNTLTWYQHNYDHVVQMLNTTGRVVASTFMSPWQLHIYNWSSFPNLLRRRLTCWNFSWEGYYILDEQALVQKIRKKTITKNSF